MILNHVLIKRERSLLGFSATGVALIFILGLALGLAACQGGSEGGSLAAKPPATVGEVSDWCGGHALPESMCTKCNPELIPKFKEKGDWCAEHGFPESACPICNPMAPPGSDGDLHNAAPAMDWCAEHALPESMCTRCNPELIPKFKEKGDWCAEHDFPESACPICNPVAPPEGLGPGGLVPGTIIRLQSPVIERAAGISVAPAQLMALGQTVEAPSEITFDQDRLAEIRAPVPGILRELRVRPGQAVSAGETLFVLQSAGVGDLQAQRAAAAERERTAEAALTRLTGLQKDGVASVRQVEAARQEVAAAAGQLAAINQALGLAGEGGESGTFTLTSPISGTVIRRRAVLGGWVEPNTPLATVADTQHMWARLAVPPGDAQSVAPGQAVGILMPELSETPYTGKVLWVAPEIDPHSRTVSVFATVHNRDGNLRANQFGTAQIQVSAAIEAVAVPKGAIQRLGEGHVVFVRTAPGRYQPRVITPGPANGDQVLVQGDLEPGSPVVIDGAFLLRTELDKGAIGAGCCEVEGPGGQ